MRGVEGRACHTAWGHSVEQGRNRAQRSIAGKAYGETGQDTFSHGWVAREGRPIHRTITLSAHTDREADYENILQDAHAIYDSVWPGPGAFGLTGHARGGEMDPHPRL